MPRTRSQRRMRRLRHARRPPVSHMTGPAVGGLPVTNSSPPRDGGPAATRPLLSTGASLTHAGVSAIEVGAISVGLGGARQPPRAVRTRPRTPGGDGAVLSRGDGDPRVGGTPRQSTCRRSTYGSFVAHVGNGPAGRSYGPLPLTSLSGGRSGRSVYQARKPQGSAARNHPGRGRVAGGAVFASPEISYERARSTHRSRSGHKEQAQ